MISILAASAVIWSMGPLDKAWAQLAHDAAVHDISGFAADRAEIARLDRTVLADWGARQREDYSGPGYTVTTYSRPTRVRGDRSRSAYFALVVPQGDLRPPTFWELTPTFSPTGGAMWILSVSRCELSSGNPIVGHPRYWRSSGLDDPPAYQDFKASLAQFAETPRAFPADTSTSYTPGTTCLYVGNIGTQHLLPAAPPS